MKFTTFQIADIGTEYLEESDLHLLGGGPCHLAELDNKQGDIFWIPQNPEYVASYPDEACKYGFSKRFIAIMQELMILRIPYVRFDADGGTVEDIDPIQEF